MKRLPHILMILSVMFLVAAEKKPDKKPEKSKGGKASAPSAARVQRWIKELDDDRFRVREEATRGLLEVGKPILPVVTEALKSSSPEVRQRAAFILNEIEKLAEEKALAALVKFGALYQRNEQWRVYEIILAKTKITDDALKHLRELSHLEKLVLKHTGISDAGLAHCKKLKNLRILSLGFTQITDAGLKHLSHSSALQGLDLDHTNITNQGLAHLKGLTNLKTLILSNTKVSNAGIAHLAGLENLKKLALYGTYVGDAGLVHLGRLTELRRLDLQHTQVTDSGLKHLEGLSNLEIVYLTKFLNLITNRGIQNLQRALPGCEIEPDPF